jgi:hypothetical protein
MMYDLPNIQRAEGACEVFLSGKQHREKFDKEAAWWAKQSFKVGG